MQRYLILFTAAFAIRLFIGLSDPFLHSWDERFHALVSKNMIEAPFKPVLREEPVLPYDATSWTAGHIWVHKQPLFLWQMAISMKIFGINTFGLRLPSIVMGALEVILLYRIALLLGLGYGAMLSACLLLFSSYNIEQCSGVIGMDHNDVAFGFYILLSFWCYFEYVRSKRNIWIFLIGCFAGFAVLNKWLPGLLIYGAWLTYMIADKEMAFKKEFRKLIISFSISCIIFIPWQIYILNKFPLQAKFTYSFNRRHITEPLEGHTGNWDYFFRLIPDQYSYIVAFLILIFLLQVFKRKKTEPAIYSILFAIAIVYIFFSFIVKTKSSNYVFIVAPFVFIIAGKGFDLIYNFTIKLFHGRVLSSLLLLLAASAIVSVFRPVTLYNFHVNDKPYLFNTENRASKRHNTIIYQKLDSLIQEESIILNCRSFEDVEAMFWSKHNVYQWYPDSMQYLELKKKGLNIVAFPDMPGQELPSYIKHDPGISILPYTLK